MFFYNFYSFTGEKGTVTFKAFYLVLVTYLRRGSNCELCKKKWLKRLEMENIILIIFENCENINLRLV